MATPVEMPKPGNTVEECFLTSWLKQRGERVSAGDVLAEIETDKATFELTAPVDGILLDTFFEPGTLIPVFTTLCVIGAEGESAEQFRPQLARAPSTGAAERDGDGATMSPRARRFSEEHDFHPQSIAGSGPGGRILESDVRERFYGEPETTPAGPSPAHAGARGPALSRVRQVIAKRLREGMSSTVQYTLHRSADAGQLLAVRRRLKASAGTADIGINELVVFCTIRALLTMPELNAELVDDALLVHREVNMGFACDTPRGLVVPVVRDSQNLSLDELARRMRELAAQAADGAINPDDLTGGTFTVSNLGSFGIESFTPVLNPPQVALLGVDAIQLKPVRKPDGNVELIDAIGLSLTVDHQVVDGAVGARFLSLVRENIEQAETLCTT